MQLAIIYIRSKFWFQVLRLSLLSLSLSVHCHTAGTLTKDTFPANFPRNIMSIHVQQCNICNTECHESTIIAHALILKSLIKMGSII